MILLRLHLGSRVLAVAPTTPAVRAEPYLHLDEEHGGISRVDVGDADIEPVGIFMKGVEVYVESTDATDVLDTSDDESERLTRIWWRATILGGAVRGGKA
jgi:hypothetical protein